MHAGMELTHLSAALKTALLPCVHVFLVYQATINLVMLCGIDCKWTTAASPFRQQAFSQVACSACRYAAANGMGFEKSAPKS